MLFNLFISFICGLFGYIKYMVVTIFYILFYVTEVGEDEERDSGRF